MLYVLFMAIIIGGARDDKDRSSMADGTPLETIDAFNSSTVNIAISCARLSQIYIILSLPKMQ